MGIKGLWTVMSPYSEKLSLHEIRGQTVAVDLAGWVCDSQNVTDYYQPKLYLRNLFFRTIYLLLADINPIFVLEGDAPELKRDVMAARNAIQFRGAAPKSNMDKAKPPDVGRRRFKNVLKECEILLKSMGVRCVKGRGEAEATCARLNAKGLVHAVVSQDSDCFAYGAKLVYRNFSVSSAGGGGAMQGSIDLYDAERMFNKIGFGRKKMVALALLCGCDYGAGACGTSITNVVNFLHTVPDDLIISRLLSWVSDPDHYSSQSRWVSVPGRCVRCGHVGRAHAARGCLSCETTRGCADTGHKSKVSEVKRELSLRDRALSSGVRFPDPKIMKEFLDNTPEDIDLNALKTPPPSLLQFVKIMSHKLDWSQKYCVEKFLPLLTKWHLQDDVPCRTIRPLEIRKKRNPKGIPSYVVVWGDIDGLYDHLITDEQLEDGDALEVWVTTERQDLMSKYYPDVVERYMESIKKPPKVKKTRGRRRKEDADANRDEPKRKYNRKVKQITDYMCELNASMGHLSLTGRDVDLNCSKVSVSVNKLKRKIKNNSKGKTKNTIESYMKPSKKRKSSILIRSLGRSCNKSIDFEVNKENFNSDKHLLSMLGDEDGDDAANLSDIVERVVSRPVCGDYVRLIFENKLKRKSVLTPSFNRNNCSTPNGSPVRKHMHGGERSRRSSSRVNTSYFFDKLTEERDAFEISMDLDLTEDCNSRVGGDGWVGNIL